MIARAFLFVLALCTMGLPASSTAVALFERQVALEVVSISPQSADISPLQIEVRDLPPRDNVRHKLVPGAKLYRGQVISVPAKLALEMVSSLGAKVTLTGPASLSIEAVYDGGEVYWLNSGSVLVDNAVPCRQVQVFHSSGAVVVDVGAFTASAPVGHGALKVQSRKGNVFVDKRFWASTGATRAGYYEREALPPGQTLATLRPMKEANENPLASSAEVDALILKFAGALTQGSPAIEALFAGRQAFWLARGLKQDRSALAIRDLLQDAGEKDPFVWLTLWQGSASKCEELGDLACAAAALERALSFSEIMYPDGLHERVLRIRGDIQRIAVKRGQKPPAGDFEAVTTRLYQRYWFGVDAGPAITSRPEMQFPREMSEWGVDGEVIIEAVVNERGVPTDLKVLQSPHPVAEAAGVQCLLQTKFSPAMLNGRPVAGKVVVPFSFQFQSYGTGSRMPGAIEKASPSFFFPKASPPGTPESLRYDKPPTLKLLPALVYPRELLAAGTRGSATATVVTDERGHVIDVKVKGATHPDFGAATKAMLQAWEMAPAQYNGKPTKTAFNFQQEFSMQERDTGVNNRTRELLDALANQDKVVVAMADLEKRPLALYRPAPVDPRVGPQPVEEAIVEFFIDPDGRVQLPKAIEAKNEELGWAAASAIKRWLYEQPTRNGRPVFVRHQLAFSFR